MSFPKVLVGVTTYEGKDYIWKEFYANLLKLSYPNFEILIVDNTRNDKYYRKLLKRTKKDFNVRVVRVERGENSRVAHANSLNKIREVVLSEGYDYFMSIESDLLPPSDIIERLMSYKKEVVGCLYQIGFNGSETQPPRPCLFEVDRLPNGDMSTKNLSPSEGYSCFGMGVRQIHGCGLGCTLISRSLLDKFPFWYYLEDKIKHSDVLFYLDLHNAHIPAFVDTDIFIPHYNQDWKLVKDA